MPPIELLTAPEPGTVPGAAEAVRELEEAQPGLSPTLTGILRSEPAPLTAMSLIQRIYDGHPS